MTRPTVWVPVAVAMVVLIVGVDVLFFRHRQYALERLLANVGIVLVFAAFYLDFFRRP